MIRELKQSLEAAKLEITELQATKLSDTSKPMAMQVAKVDTPFTMTLESILEPAPNKELPFTMTLDNMVSPAKEKELPRQEMPF